MTASSTDNNIQQIKHTDFQISEILLESTFIGGSEADYATCITIDESGNFYIVGSTQSSDFPTVNPAYATLSGEGDIFAMKINNAGTEIIYSTFIGGSSSDSPLDCAVDCSGNLYIVGYTLSSDFPTANALYPNNNGNYEGFVLKLNPDGSALEYSTYIGGPQDDHVTSIVVDASGNAIISGPTRSSSFPIKNAIDGTFSGGSDDFLMKLNSTGNGIIYSTFIGGSGSESSETTLTLDATGNVYMGGLTASTDFPVTSGSYDTTISGPPDVFLVKISNTGDAIQYGTFLGGSGSDVISSIVINDESIVVVGMTESSDFPLESPIFDEIGGSFDIYVTQINIDTNELEFSTYIGDSGFDYAASAVIDEDGNLYISGTTDSVNFPLVDEIDDTMDELEGVILILSTDTKVLSFSSYVGGSKDDSIYSVVVDDDGVMSLVGSTQSSDFQTRSALDDSFNGIHDGFFMRISMGIPTTGGDSTDTDHDGLSDFDEIYIYGTDWQNPDTDSDGCPDGWEVARGLDPLEWTNSTGEAQEHLLATLVPAAGGFAATLVILVVTAVIGLNAWPLRRIRSRILILPAIVFLLAVFLVAPTSVYGTTDPGSNIVSQSGSSSLLSMSYTVIDSPWYGNTTTITTSYVAEYIDVWMTVYVTIEQGSTTIGVYDLRMGGGFVGVTQRESITLTLDPGTYEIARTYTYLDIFDQSVGSRSCTVTISQSETDGRNSDQRSWPAIFGTLVMTGIGLVVIGLFIKTDLINKKWVKPPD